MKKNDRIEHIRNWEKSGLSKIDYCRQNQLNYLTFMGWLRKYQIDLSGKLKTDWIEIPKEESKISHGNYLQIRILEDWKFEIVIRFGNDIS